MATRWGWLPRKAARNQLHLSLPIGIYPFARFKIVELHAYFPGEGNGNPLHYFCLENPMDRGAWQATAHGVAKSQTRLSIAHTLPSWNWVQNSPDLSNRPSISFPPSFVGASPRCHSLTTGPWNSGPSSIDKGMAVPSLLNTTEVFTTFPSKSVQAVRTGCGDSKEG